jgi:hypothetical protein
MCAPEFLVGLLDGSSVTSQYAERKLQVDMNSLLRWSTTCVLHWRGWVESISVARR